MNPSPQQLPTHIDPSDWSETVCLLEMTSVGARIQPHKESMIHARDRAPHTGAPTNTEQQDTSHHHGMNHDPVHPDGNEGILQAKCAYIWHRTNTSSIFIPFYPNHLPHWCWQGICKACYDNHMHLLHPIHMKRKELKIWQILDRQTMTTLDDILSEKIR